MPRSWTMGFRVGALLVVSGFGVLLAAGRIDGASKVQDPKIDTAALERKLDQVLANQQTILQTLNAMTEELRIIKVRATR